MRKIEDVYREIVKEVYVKFFVANISVVDQMNYMCLIVNNFPQTSATKKFINCIKYKRNDNGMLE